MKIKRKANLKGYITLHRSIQQLIESRKLNFSSLGAYIGFALVADWDSKHDTYCCLLKTDEEIASEWKVDPATVWRHRKNLINKGLLAVRQDGLTYVVYFKFFEHKYNKIVAGIPISPMQENNAESQEDVGDMQETLADLQEDEVQNAG